jgi:hypothetical protein
MAKYIRSELSTDVIFKIVVHWVVIPLNFIVRYGIFRKHLASVSRVEMFRFKNRLGYTGMLPRYVIVGLKQTR